MGLAKFSQEIYEKRWENLQYIEKIWAVLVKAFFQPLIDEQSAVLDIGCGFCHFLNHLKAKEKVGVDANPLAGHYVAKDVTFIHTSDLSLKMLPNNHFDCVFMSNFLEHLDGPKDVLNVLRRTWELLRSGGKTIILQPNFRLLGSAYFDFIDHKTILTDRSLEEALNVIGFKIEKKIIRFLPYTTRSKIPKHPSLVRLYLMFRPIWFLMGKQSLFVAVKQIEQTFQK